VIDHLIYGKPFSPCEFTEEICGYFEETWICLRRFQKEVYCRIIVRVPFEVMVASAAVLSTITVAMASWLLLPLKRAIPL